MSLFFGYSVPGFHNNLGELRNLLAELGPNSPLRSVLDAELNRVEQEYPQCALRILHTLYNNARWQTPPRQVALLYEYTETILSASEEALQEWRARGANILQRFAAEPPNNRFARIDRGIQLTFVDKI